MDIKKTIETIRDTPTNFPPISLYDLPSTLDYDCRLNNTSQKVALHKGQRKLFNALMYFLTRYTNPNTSYTLLYIGAGSGGTNIRPVSLLFSNIKFILYDSEPIRIKQSNNIKIVNSLFTQNHIEQYKNIKNLLIFSDIRNINPRTKTVTETNVRKDLTLQQDIIKKTNPAAWCVKFRVPYVTASNEKTKQYIYLDGDPILQCYAKIGSGETRLMSDKIEDKKWTLKDYENRMFFLNIVLREWQYYKNTSEDVKDGDHCFDCSLEEFFCGEFIEKYGSMSGKFETVAEMRNWISKQDGTLSLYNEAGYYIDSKKQKKYWNVEHKTTEYSYKKTDKHGDLPYKRDVKTYLKYADIKEITLENILKYSDINEKYTPELKKIIKAEEDLLKQSITHKSMGDTNYEEMEFVGDGLLDLYIKEFVSEYYSGEVAAKSSISTMFSSGEQATEIFSKKLSIKEILCAHIEEDEEKILEDAFEAYLYALKKILDKCFNDATGYLLCKHIMYSLLKPVDISGIYKHKVFPPKTRLKELFDEQQSLNKNTETNYWNFNNTYKIYDAKGDIIRSKELKEWDKTQLTIRLDFPERFMISVPSYTETGPQKQVEMNACLAFLEFFSNRGYVLKPKEKYFYNRVK